SGRETRGGRAACSGPADEPSPAGNAGALRRPAEQTFYAATPSCTQPEHPQVLKNPTSDRVNGELLGDRGSGHNHARRGRVTREAILLNTHNSSGQITNTNAPKSKAAAALPVHLAAEPAIIGLTIMAP